LTGFETIIRAKTGDKDKPDIMYWFLHLLPLVIAVFALITFFNIHAYLFKCLDIDIYSRPRNNDEEHIQRIAEGKQLVERETKRGRSESGRIIEPIGGIHSQGYRAPRRSIVMNNNSSSGGKMEHGGDKKKTKKKRRTTKEMLHGDEDGAGESLLGDDSLSGGLSDYGKQEGFVGAGTRAIMGGGSGGSSSKTTNSTMSNSDFTDDSSNALKKKGKKKKNKVNSTDESDFGNYNPGADV
jgi:hypothetical protein